MSPDEVDLPVSLADDLSTKPRTLRESVQHQWVRNMTDADWRRLIAHYHGLVAHVDTEVGRMLDHLQAEGLADDTIVVVLSDHGESLGAHRMIEKGPSMYEESLGIPFIVHWPGRIDAGQVSAALFSTVDLPITLGDLCDVAVDAGEGRSFADVWTSGAPAPRDAIFAEFYSHFEDQHQFIKTVCTDCWKLNLFLLDEYEGDYIQRPHRGGLIGPRDRHVLDDGFGQLRRRAGQPYVLFELRLRRLGANRRQHDLTPLDALAALAVTTHSMASQIFPAANPARAFRSGQA